MASNAQDTADEQVRQVALEAYLYLYPLVMMDVTRRQMTNSAAGQQVGFGPMNTFTHMRAFPPPEFKAVPWANLDTLYSLAWLDLTEGPLIITTPDTGDRYYLLPIQDMWTDVFAVPGKRTSGTRAGQFAVVPPGWQGELPADLSRIQATTPMAWIIGRTQTDGVDDYPSVHRAQDGFGITPLSHHGQQWEPVPVAVDPSVDMTTPPVAQVNHMPGTDFFAYAAELMRVHPPHPTDWSILQRMRRIGLEPGKSFKTQTLVNGVKQALDQAASDGQEAMRAKVPTLAPLVNGWQVPAETMGVYGNHYLKRATLAMVGLGSNPPEDAIYPLTFTDGDGNALDGEHDYKLRFDADDLPPAGAFWSLTLYDHEGFQIPNDLDRCALGDRDPLRREPDGSLELLIQHKDPGQERASNWLPSQPGAFALFLRLYEPRAQALDGTWKPPAVRRVH